MSEKRFSVFISSTFEDLRDERQAVQDAVLSAGDFPVQMETFPAADEDQFDFIKSLIDKCDYYVLVVAGRYGTPCDDGMSYTEKEYRYAKERGIPVLVILHGDRGKIAIDRSEATSEGTKRLEKFIEEISTGRLRKNWTEIGGLKHLVRDALDHAKATRPGVGWVRGDTVAGEEILAEINQVRKENQRFRDMIGTSEIESTLPPIPDPAAELEIDLIPRVKISDHKDKWTGTPARIQGSWLDLYPIFLSAAKWISGEWNGEYSYYFQENESCNSIGERLGSEICSFDTSGLYAISQNNFDRLHSYYIEVGLIQENGDQPFTELGKRVARRHQISRLPNALRLVGGEIERKNISDYDDIPF